MGIIAQITYPATPPVPPAPLLSQMAGAYGGPGARTEYYVITYVTPEGETLQSPETAIAATSGNVVVIAPPPYPYPFAEYGYNVYGATSSGAEVLQTSTPVLSGTPWTEPYTGLLTYGNAPPTGWANSVLTFGRFSFPTKVPAYDRSVVKHSNVAASGLLETIYEHTDYFSEITVEAVQLGVDIENWNTFVAYAEQGGIFSFYPDNTDLTTFKNYTLWDAEWVAAYRSVGLYNFKMKWRQALGNVGTGGGGGGMAGNYASNITPLDSGDHTHFTLPSTPNPPSTLQLFLKGAGYVDQFLFQGARLDYTVSGNAITLNFTLSGAFTLVAYYFF